MNFQTITTKQTRDNLAEIIDQVYIAEKSFIITRSGKQKAMIVPIQTSKSEMVTSSQKQDFSQAIEASFGMWSDLPGIEDAAEFVQKLRQPRHEIFD